MDGGKLAFNLRPASCAYPRAVFFLPLLLSSYAVLEFDGFCLALSISYFVNILSHGFRIRSESIFFKANKSGLQPYFSMAGEGKFSSISL